MSFDCRIEVKDVEGTDYTLDVEALMEDYDDGGEVLRVTKVTFVEGTDWRWDGDRGLTLSLDMEIYGLSDCEKFGDYVWNRIFTPASRESAREQIADLYRADVERRREAA